MKTNQSLPQFKPLNKNLGFLRQGFLFVLFFIPFLVLALGGFSFSTEPQSIGVGELSGPITVHSETDVSETTYILLSSDSTSGQFFSSKTSSEPIVSGSYIYISTGNANRTFYYKDSSSGNFVVTAEIYNKAKTEKLATLTQNISIGSSNTGDSSGVASTTDNSTSSDSTVSSSSSSNSNYSAHSSPAPLSETENKIDFEISAGRDRLTSVGSLVTFVVSPTKLQNVSSNNIRYEWSFGDGGVSQGNTVTHAYRFSGDYSVVVNAYYSDKQAVSRLAVKVIEPKISMERVPGGFSILNNSGAEINLGGWNLVGKTKIFNFPKDTLIPNNKKIIFADDLTGINDSLVRLENPLGKNYAEILEKPEVLGVSIDVEKISEEVNKVKENIELLKPEVEKISVNEQVRENVGYLSDEVVPKENLDQDMSVLEEPVIFEAPKEEGMVNKIFHWPIAGFELVRNWFR